MKYERTDILHLDAGAGVYVLDNIIFEINNIKCRTPLPFHLILERGAGFVSKIFIT